MAAEVKLLNPQQQVTLVHSRQRLLSSEPLADLYKDKVLELVREAGVEVVLGSRVAKQEADATGATTVTLENGHALRASVVIDAISRFSPRHPYLPQKALDEQGYVRITSTLNLPDIVPNSDCHYAAGDIVKWSGIKRAGAAMHHGHLVAQNIHQHLLLQQHKLRPQTDGSETGAFTPNYSHLEAAEPGMCVAIGKKAAAYSDTWGLQEGEETLKLFFEDDLGFNICWKHMGLGIEPPA
ncbi:hypothetical protein KEM52_001064 [Ascosphaera acerosa]|nr:hypothetical protein KEM52_001064 [Ascosphaera acerosa]